MSTSLENRKEPFAYLLDSTIEMAQSMSRHILSKSFVHRKRKLGAHSRGTATPSDEDRPYLQQKGELEAEDKTKHELQADHRRYGLTDDNEIREMSTQQTPELRGEQHSTELD